MSLQAKRFYDFEDFRLDFEENVLRCNDKPLAITPKAFQLLKILVENHGRIVDKEKLLSELWADCFVEEGNLAYTVRLLRKILNDDAQQPKFIETVPRRGYRFIAAIKEVLPADPPKAIESSEPQSLISDEAFVLPLADDKINQKPIKTLGKSWSVLALSLLLIAVVFLTASGFIHWTNSYRSSAFNFRQIHLNRLTSFGNSYLAAISPDGRYVVQARDDGGKQSLWVRQTGEERDIEIVPPSDVEYRGITVSPDSQHVFYAAWDLNKSDVILYQTPILGGTPQKITSDISSAVTFSPDGMRIAFFHGRPSSGISHLIIARTDGSEEKVLAERKIPDSFETFFGSPTWSPDGRTIVAVVSSTNVGVKSRLLAFDAESGAERTLTQANWAEIGQIAWLNDASGLLMIAQLEAGQPMQIWHVSYTNGEAEKITNDLNDYRGLSLTANSKTIVTTQIEQNADLRIAPVNSIENGKVVSSESGTHDAMEGLAWTPDDKLIFRFNENGQDNLWQIGRDGNGRKQLTADNADNIAPTVCGNSIVFVSKRTGTSRLWLADRDGTDTRLLTDDNNSDGELFPNCAASGGWVIYQKGWRRGTIWKVPLAGGTTSPVAINTLAIRPAVSPDGKFVAYYFLDKDIWGLAVVSLEGDEPQLKFSLPASVASRYVRWTPNGTTLAYIDTRDGVSNIWLQPVNGGIPRQLTNFNDGRIFYFDWSPDGKNFAIAHGTISSDAVLISDGD